MLALRRSASIAQKRVASSQVACFASDTFQNKEKAAEAAFFNKEDERALRKLLQKLKGQSDVVDPVGLKAHVAHDHAGLEKIAGLKLTPEQTEALLKWKHEH